MVSEELKMMGEKYQNKTTQSYVESTKHRCKEQAFEMKQAILV